MSAEYEYVRYDQKGKPLSVDYRGMLPCRAGRRMDLGDLLLAEGIQCLLKGEVEAGKNALKHCIHATTGFAGLAEQTGQPLESLTLMFRRGGSPKIQDFFEVINHIGQQRGIMLEINAVAQENANGQRRPRGRYTRNRPPRAAPLAEHRARNALADYRNRKQ